MYKTYHLNWILGIKAFLAAVPARWEVELMPQQPQSKTFIGEPCAKQHMGVQVGTNLPIPQRRTHTK